MWTVRSTPHTPTAVSTQKNKKTENVTLHTQLKGAVRLIMPPTAAFVSRGLMCGGEGLRETPWPGMGPAAVLFEVTVGTRSFIFTEKNENSRDVCDWQTVLLAQ